MTQDLLAKAKACKTPEELLSLARENGLELTETQAKDYYAKLNPGNEEIADEELSSVSGGGCGSEPEPEPEPPQESNFISYIPCPRCKENRWYVRKENPRLLKCRGCGYPMIK